MNPRHHLARVHARLDDFERDLALHGLLLLGVRTPDRSRPRRFVPELVRPDHRPGLFGEGSIIGSCRSRAGPGLRENSPAASWAASKTIDLAPQVGISAAGFVEIAGSLGNWLLRRGGKDGFKRS